MKTLYKGEFTSEVRARKSGSLFRDILHASTVLIMTIGFLCGTSMAGPVDDPISGSTPSFDEAPMKGTNYNSGDWGVSDQNGTATYTYNIDLPPGRHGMAPQLTFRYASNLPLRGGLAVGWTFHIPSIEQDTSLGEAEGSQFRIDLGSASGRLIEVPDVTPFPNSKAYRVNYDPSNTRIFATFTVGPRPVLKEWIALTPDGVRHFFKESNTSKISGVVWHLTRQVDPYGNTTKYNWSDLFNTKGFFLGESLSSIEYTSNELAGLLPHAKIEFEYDQMQFCFDTDDSTAPASAIISDIPIGAAYRKGGNRPQNIVDEFDFVQATGAQQLATVKVLVRDTQSSDWRLSKRIDLEYKLRNSILYPSQVITPLNPLPAGLIRCKQNPMRYLTQIDVEAFDFEGVSTVIPPIKFEYNQRINTSLPILGGFPPREHLHLTEIASPGFGQEGISGGDLGGLKTTLLDIDNDGIRDRVSVIEENKICTLVWNKGQLGGTFAAQEFKSALPTADWYRDWSNSAPNPFIDDKEGCSVNGQIAYRTTPHTTLGLIGDTWVKGVLNYHFMDYTGDGRLDLITNAYAPFGFHCSYDPWSTGCSIAASGEPVSGITSIDLVPEKNNAWRVYAGTGNVDQPFANNVVPAGIRPIRTTVTAPLPMPPSIGDETGLDSSVTTVYSVPVLFDMDGDGFLDIVASQIEGQLGCTNKILLKSCDWTVYFGNGTGKFPERAQAHIWKVPKISLDIGNRTSQTVGNTPLEYVKSRATFIKLSDLNGDGLADLIVRKLDDKKLYSYRNTGSEFERQARPLNANTPVEKVDTDVDSFIANRFTNGDRGYSRRLLDLDSDGLLDMVWFEGDRDDITSTNVVMAKFNLGNRFGNSVALLTPEKWARGKRLVSASWQSGFDGNWHVATDFTDVDGDGISDLVQWHGNTMSFFSSPGLRQAPDLLKKVINGRGLELNFSYASSSDPAVVTWTGNSSPLPGENSALPRVNWVVEKLTVDSGHGAPVKQTQYQYQNPNYSSAGTQTGFKERSQFAGFSSNTQTVDYANGTTKQTVKQYEYTGLKGVLVGTQTFQDGSLHRATRKTWEQNTLFNGLIHVALPSSSLTCTSAAPTSSVDDCFAQDDHVHRNLHTWTHDNDSNQFQNSHTVEGVGKSASAADLRTSFQYYVRYGSVTGNDPEDYRVRVQSTTKSIRGALNNFATEVGKLSTAFNDSTGLPDHSTSFQNASIFATTNYEYDPLTGNLLVIQKPMQSLSVGGTDALSELSYDSHQLFVQGTLNELNHQTKTTYDTATGALLKREGPNVVSGSSPPIFDTELWTIDGFGRVSTHSVSIDLLINGSPSYSLRPVERFTYNDMEFQETGNPVSLQTEQLVDFGDADWIKTEQKLDGQGRVLETRQLFNGAMTTHTTYAYSDSGGISRMETPDPRDPNSRVEYTYGHDALGRVVIFERPDGTRLAIDYEGLAQTTSEQTPDDSGGSTTKHHDVFGRLVEVQEDSASGSPAITRYEYDVVDNLIKIIDAEDKITMINNDWQGNRTQIIRGQRTWDYSYDLNNNLLRRQSPVALGSDPTIHATTYSYDDLDRLTSKSFVDIRISTPPSSTASTPPATGPMRTTRFHYDAGHNGTGRLSEVEIGIGSLTQVDQPYAVVRNNYDARGFIVREERSFTLDQIAPMEAMQVVERVYNSLGQMTQSDWQGEKWKIQYDDRGLVDSVKWFDPTAPADAAWKTVANYDRDLIGLPRVRNTDFGQTRRFTYDALARPVTDRVNVDSSTTMIAERIYAYSGAGNLETVTGHTNGEAANANYSFDLQHRLLSASAPNGYTGSFSYSPTGNVMRADVQSANVGETRTVQYSYGQTDPQAVDELEDVSTASIFASFAYDVAGNMTWRRTSDGEILLHWDGQDQIRRVDTPGGSETYYYDHAGQRMLAVSQNQGVRFWFGERETHFNLAGAEVRKYLHLSAGGPILARVENETEIELQYADALQNLMFSLDEESNISASFMYGPFGEVVSETGGDTHRRKFNGKEDDVVSGLRYYGFRYYDPLAMRWNSADPLFAIVPELGQNQPQRLNLYAFSLNNPVRYYDPDGRNADDGGSDIGNKCDWGSGCCNAPGQALCNSDDSGESDKEDSEDMITVEGVDEDGNPTLLFLLREPEAPACDKNFQSCAGENHQQSLDIYISIVESRNGIKAARKAFTSKQRKQGKEEDKEGKHVMLATGSGCAAGATKGGFLGCLAGGIIGGATMAISNSIDAPDDRMSVWEQLELNNQLTELEFKQSVVEKQYRDAIRNNK